MTAQRNRNTMPCDYSVFIISNRYLLILPLIRKDFQLYSAQLFCGPTVLASGRTTHFASAPLKEWRVIVLRLEEQDFDGIAFLEAPDLSRDYHSAVSHDKGSYEP